MLQPFTVNGTELGAQEWQDALFLRYGINSLDLPHYCDGCNATFSICHVLYCKRGGLVTACHNKICDRVADLAGKSFTFTHVCNDPPIFAFGLFKAQPAKMRGSLHT